MHKFTILSLLIFFFSYTSHAQPATIANDHLGIFEYYIRISGINTKQDVLRLQDHITQKRGVSFFMANRFPVRYFLMRSNRKITASEFESWLINTNWQIEVFGEGSKAKEQATLLYHKKTAPR